VWNANSNVNRDGRRFTHPSASNTNPGRVTEPDNSTGDTDCPASDADLYGHSDSCRLNTYTHCNRDFGCLSDGSGNCDGYCHSHVNGHIYSDVYVYTDGNVYRYSYCYSYIYTDGNLDLYGHCDSYIYTDRDIHSYRNEYSNSNSNSYSYSYSDGDSDSHGDARKYSYPKSTAG
jgi:hypothetical protein